MTVEGIERGTQRAIACPSCSPDAPQVHEVLKPDAHATVRCLSCEHVHKASLEPSSTVRVRTVVSVEDESERVEVEAPREEPLSVGEEFVADSDEGPIGVRITSLELEDGSRVETASAVDVATIWTRAVDNVAVDTTIHPADGAHDRTRSETYYLPGDEELTVGQPVPHLDESVRVEGIVLRDDAMAYDRRKLDRRGRSAPAKDIKRLYVRECEGDTWRSPWE